jgi:RNA polymerase subunit RPABC4/transcription elongation factor Spt4
MTVERFKDEWLKENSLNSRNHIKKYLIKFGLLKWECSECRNAGDWRGKKLVLQLEHKNGISNDNRLENLCFLCPNCHSQTETFAGRSSQKTINLRKIKNKKKTNACYKCKKEISEKAKVCLKCNGKEKHKINWPDDATLGVLINGNSLLSLSKKLGVSDNAIRKYCKVRNISSNKNFPATI